MFLIYLILRLFRHDKELLIWGDEARHLTTARNFYKMWNKSFYDMHPPLYSWLIRQFSKFMKDYKAGIIVSLLCSIGYYFVCSALYEELGLTSYEKLIALAFITFNYTLIYYSNRIFRYQLIALLGVSGMYFLVTHNPILAGLSWGLLSLTCVFAGLRFFWAWLFINPSLISIFIWAWFFGEWLLKKMGIYSTHDYYPSGVDGKIEPVKDFTWKQLLSPLYFPYNYNYYGKNELGYDFRNWYKKIRGIFGFYQTKNKQLNTILVIISILLVIVIVKGMLQSQWYLSVITLLLLYPSLYKRWLPRNSIIVIPLLGYFLGKEFPHLPLQCLYFAFIGVAIVFLFKNHAWLFPKPKWQGGAIAGYLRTLPKDGILAEGLIAYSMAYLTDKRVVVIPHTPDINEAIRQTDLSIKEFDLSYVVFSELYETDIHLGYPAIDYIKSFKLISIIQEKEDIYYIYEIPTNFPA